MTQPLVCWRPRTATALCAAPLLLAAACLTSCRSAPEPPEVDPDESAAWAMDHYDSNHDGIIDKSEIAACPPLDAAAGAYDSNADGGLTQQEIAQRLFRLFAGHGLVELTCVVTLDGRPLAGARVKFLPAEMLAGAVHPAEATTDEDGRARPTISAELRPEEFKTSPLMNPGLYSVEITHSDERIPDRYNAATTLGFEVDEASRGGLAARFNLKSR